MKYLLGFFKSTWSTDAHCLTVGEHGLGRRDFVKACLGRTRQYLGIEASFHFPFIRDSRTLPKSDRRKFRLRLDQGIPASFIIGRKPDLHLQLYPAKVFRQFAFSEQRLFSTFSH